MPDSNPTTSATSILRKRLATSPERLDRLDTEYERLRLAELVRQMRTGAGMSQAELADRIGSKQSAISRLESPSYKNANLKTILQIAHTLGYRLRLDVEPVSRGDT